MAFHAGQVFVSAYHSNLLSFGVLCSITSAQYLENPHIKKRYSFCSSRKIRELISFSHLFQCFPGAHYPRSDSAVPPRCFFFFCQEPIIGSCFCSHLFVWSPRSEQLEQATTWPNRFPVARIKDRIRILEVGKQSMCFRYYFVHSLLKDDYF